jgi:energy-converting hydrogenase Eha subunit F
MNRKNEYSRPFDRPQMAPLPPLAPYQRCACGSCRECQDNQKWDRVFAKFEITEDNWKTKGFFQSTLRGL